MSSRREISRPIAATWAAALAAATAALLLAGHAAPAQGARTCGTTSLYGHALEIVVTGRPLACDAVRRIIRGGCHEGPAWDCLAPRPPGPLQVWFRKRETFAARWTSAIEARRYPCRDARVTAATWAKAGTATDHGTPTWAEVQADDLPRCHRLDGMTRDAVLALLGPPDRSRTSNGASEIDYDLGLERGSLFAIDNELLVVRFRASGVVATAWLAAD